MDTNNKVVPLSRTIINAKHYFSFMTWMYVSWCCDIEEI